MNPKQYVQDAIRTESIVPRAVVNDKFAFQATVEAFIACATLLDLYKKNIYYNKPIDANKWHDSVNGIYKAIRHLNLNVGQRTDVLDIDSRILHAIIGIATESGELMEAVRGKLSVSTALDNVNLQEEVGDLNWYEAILIDALGADWDEIRERNIAKLKARYPDKFSSENAINRDVQAERKILEGSPGCDARAKADYFSVGGSDY